MQAILERMRQLQAQLEGGGGGVGGGEREREVERALPCSSLASRVVEPALSGNSLSTTGSNSLSTSGVEPALTLGLERKRKRPGPPPGEKKDPTLVSIRVKRDLEIDL